MPVRFHAFWAINDRLSEAELCRQLGEMKRFGFDGVVWQPRFYPSEPEADAVHVAVGGIELGWVWGPDWTVRIPECFPAGEHHIVVSLIPSGLNSYGPHHHIDGDPHIVSPTQYDYSRNFADRPDSPENTRVEAWHFKPGGVFPVIQQL